MKKGFLLFLALLSLSGQSFARSDLIANSDMHSHKKLKACNCVPYTTNANLPPEKVAVEYRNRQYFVITLPADEPKESVDLGRNISIDKSLLRDLD